MSESVLNNIVADRRRSVETDKARFSANQVRAWVESEMTPLSLSAVMKLPGMSLIAEIKPARPGIGELKKDLSVSKLAEAYWAGGARAVSVLTEPDHFKGAWMNLRVAKECSTLITMCKDFIVDEFQLELARAFGADAVLLIAAVLDDLQLKKMIKASHKLEMEVLTEAINEEELKRVVASGTDIIGVNSRNLHTLEVDLDGALELIGKIKDRRPVVIESGICSRADVVKTEEAGASGILVGTALMEADDPAAKIRELLEIEGADW